MSSSQNCEISNEIRKLIIDNYNKGNKMVDISKIFNVNYNSVKTIIQRFKKTGATKIKKRIGRSKKLTPRNERIILRELKKNRRQTKQHLLNTFNNNQNVKISARTLKRFVNKKGYKKCKAIKKPFISSKNRKLRELWAKNHLSWSLDQWKQIVWSDECHIEHDNQKNILVWRKPNEKLINDCTKGTLKSGRFSITIWGCIGWEGVGPIKILEGKLNSKKYIKLLNDVHNEIKIKFGDNIKFQDDNAPIHRASNVTQWKNDNKIESIEWVPQSPDLNVIENVWSHLKRELGKNDKIPSNIEILKNQVIHVWSNISPSYIQNLITSMNKRCSSVIQNKGFSIPY